ncbi:hypothetical protein HKD37_11G031777 [Glycine soja]
MTSLEKKNSSKASTSTTRPMGRGMLKFTTMQLIGNEDVKGSQTFDVNEDQLQPYLSAPIVEPDLPNKELNCFSEDEHEVQHNQPQEDHEEELSLFHQ